jgi:hypothetical protein
MGLYPLWFLISIRSLEQVGYRQHALGQVIAYLKIIDVEDDLTK